MQMIQKTVAYLKQSSVYSIDYELFRRVSVKNPGFKDSSTVCDQVFVVLVNTHVWA